MIALGLLFRRRMRTVTPVLPAESGEHDGLAYTVWLPARRSTSGGVVILHGAGSCKENHYDFARGAVANGLAALVFDQRGHGASQGPMDARVLDDVAAMAELLRERAGSPALSGRAARLEHGRLPGDPGRAARRREGGRRHLPGQRRWAPAQAWPPMSLGFDG